MTIAPRYQTIGPRILAAIVDTFVFMPLIVATSVLDQPDSSQGLYLFISVAGTTLGFGYNIYLHGRYGQTLGKIVAKVQVVSLDETPIDLYTAFRRELLYLPTTLMFEVLDFYRFASSDRTAASLTSGVALVDILTFILLAIFLVDVIVTLASDKRRSLHDLIAGTVVVRLNA